MTVHHVGHEAGAMTTVYSPPYTTTAGNFYSRSRCAIQVQSAASGMITFPEFSSEQVWLHFAMKISAQTTVSTNANWIVGRDAANNQAFRISNVGSSTSFLVYGRGDTLLFTTTSVEPTVLHTFDIGLQTVGSDTLVSVYRDGTLIGQGTEVGVVPRALAKVVFQTSHTTTYLGYYSEIIVADEPTVGWTVATLAPTGAGDYTDWSGAYTDVDEITPDTAYAESTAAEEKVTYANAGVASILGSNRIKAVALCGYVSSDVGLKSIVRSGTTDSIAEITGVPASFGPVKAIFNEDPITAAPWGQTDISAYEFGYESM